MERGAGPAEKLKAAGVHTAVDTCGLTQQSVFEALLPYTDLFLYDLKLFDDDAHRRFTGQSNALIFSNFAFLTAQGARIWVRTPIIPGATDTDDNIRGLATLVQNKVEKWELCAFNNLCRDKYERLGRDWDFKAAGLIEKETMEHLTALAIAAGAQSTVWSGATARTED